MCCRNPQLLSLQIIQRTVCSQAGTVFSVMATSVKLGALLLPVFMSTVGHCFARPNVHVSEHQHDWPYWDNLGPTGGQPVSSFEPSSRDLNIGFSVGRDDSDDEKLRSHTSGKPIRSGYVAGEGYRDRRPEDFNIDVVPDRPGSRYASAEGRSRSRSDGGTVDDDGYPGVISQPLDFMVGEFKLRNDRGYQLSMHVPPSSAGDRPGVLKIDMQATLYRPIYY